MVRSRNPEDAFGTQKSCSVELIRCGGSGGMVEGEQTVPGIVFLHLAVQWDKWMNSKALSNELGHPATAMGSLREHPFCQSTACGHCVGACGSYDFVAAAASLAFFSSSSAFLARAFSLSSTSLAVSFATFLRLMMTL